MLSIYLTLLDTDEQKSKFEYIYTKYRGGMYQIAMETIHDSHLAEDIVHETFLKLIQTIDKVRAGNEKELRSFLKTITYHQAIDFIRKRNSQKRQMKRVSHLPHLWTSLEQRNLS